jgi:uncharacterized protein YjbJ (UPF0337 family)
MNDNQSNGAGKELRGKIKDAAGGLTGDRSLKAEGKLDKGAGKVQKKVGDAQAETNRRDDRDEI